MCEILIGVCFSFGEHLLTIQNTFFLNSAEQKKCSSTKAFITVRPRHPRLWLPENFYFQMKRTRSGAHTCGKQNSQSCVPAPFPQTLRRPQGTGRVFTHFFLPGCDSPIPKGVQAKSGGGEHSRSLMSFPTHTEGNTPDMGTATRSAQEACVPKASWKAFLSRGTQGSVAYQVSFPIMRLGVVMP